MLHSALLLGVRFAVPSAEEYSLVVFGLGFIASIAGFTLLSLLVAGFAISAVIHVALYENVSGLNFNLHQLIQNPLEAIESVILTLGELKTIVAIVEFAATVILSAWISRLALHRSERVTQFKYPAILVVFFGLYYFAKLSFYYFSPAPPIQVHFEGNRNDIPTDDQSLIMVQLESLNGPVIYDSKLEFPTEKKAHEMGGVTLPLFWASTFGTNLGFSSILCGTSGAMTFHLVRPPDDIPCLPERFRRAGFETVYYYSYKAADFYDMEKHVSKIGFQKFIYGEKLMDKADSFFSWGYDDCRFYDRAVADMKRSGLDQKKKIFVYFSVHMNHTPFENHLAIDHPYPEPMSPVETYLNSAYEQDLCLSKFLEHIREMRRDDLNIVISGDHGFPVKHRHELYDHYMTRFQFIPSEKNRSKFKVGSSVDVSPAQDQIQSTVLELFGASRSPASFLWALQGRDRPEDYRKCILIADKTTNSVYSVYGDEAVRRFTVLNTFTKLSYEKGNLKDSVPLTDMNKWKLLSTPQECLERMGAPSIR